VNTGKFFSQVPQGTEDALGAMISALNQSAPQGETTNKSASLDTSKSATDAPGNTEGAGKASSNSKGEGGGSGNGGGNSLMQDLLTGAAFLNVETPDAIRTDGTGSAAGIPGGQCGSCAGSAAAQGVYLGAAVPGVLSGLAKGLAKGVARAASTVTKDALRTAARGIWAGRMGTTAAEMGLQIHHRIPLEYAHLFPKADPQPCGKLDWSCAAYPRSNYSCLECLGAKPKW
jgi:hypothetical protein